MTIVLSISCDLLRSTSEYAADRLWSAGAVLPLSVGEATIRPQAVRSMTAHRKGASMACALQTVDSQTGPAG
jgi:hypothetical protein